MLMEPTLTTAVASPWGSQLPSREPETAPHVYHKYLDTGDLDADIQAIEAEIERVKQEKQVTQEYRRNLSTGNSASCSTSVASSEYDADEDTIIDVGGISDNFFSGSESDYLNTSILNLLEDGNATDHVSLSTFELSDSDLDLQVANNVSVTQSNDNKAESIPSLPNPPSPPKKKRKHLDNVPWTDMSDEEQISVVENLSHVISNSMGLREQLEVIRIISPDAKIHPTDSEFVIDLDEIDDAKLQQVRNFVKTCIDKRSKDCSSSSSSCSESSSSGCSSSSDGHVHTMTQAEKTKESKVLNLQRVKEEEEESLDVDILG
ncbi:PREDICTED: protein FAM199X-B-like isoform X2 [Branchiostoma belcheri]|uniref:Protein FAM199X-B-like isoform X2 n=1 Tax=Branchiostoma belcheri TaxID=7741 RepID=A0A6P5AA05_BRABE|nr:PREDICTED: protein FAM199X-B-like isoform X2 [Branchiostoma belcheri]